MVTEVFLSDDPFLDQDAVFGVREQLIMQYIEQVDIVSLPDGLEIGREVTLPFDQVLAQSNLFIALLPKPCSKKQESE